MLDSVTADPTERLERLRALADCARRQGCTEVAIEIDRLAAMAAELLPVADCLRCGSALASGARLRLLFTAPERVGECWRGVICDDCVSEFRAWFQTGGGDLNGCQPEPPHFSGSA
jgi:hypothetical protein